MVITMDYITKETLNKYVKDKSIIELKDFAEIFVKEFGIVMPLTEKVDLNNLTDEQKKKMTKAIFTNEDVLEQLRKASIDPQYVEDDEEALNTINEGRNER
jgi:hypothetical protein